MTRLETGVPELDLVLGGGFLPGSLVIVSGAPGAGKTILAQQICFGAATPERKAIYYTTLSEPHSKLVRHLEEFEFFDPAALEERVEFIHLGDLVRKEANTDGVPDVLSEVVRKCFEGKPTVVVIDSSKALRDFVDERHFREVIYDMASRVAHTEAVLLFLGEYTLEEMEGRAEFSLADSIVHLAFQPHEPVDRRWLRVVKLRGARHLSGRHSFDIGMGGIKVFPRLETLLPADRVGVSGRVFTGVPGLDDMMGGGIPAGDATAILGSSGVGKTVLALRFMAEGLENGERCLYVSFQEDAGQLVAKAASFGWDLSDAVESGQFVIHHIPHGNLNLDAVGAAVRRELSKGSMRRVAIDSLAELVVTARESERFPAYARSLVGFIRAAGASLVITSETTTLGPISEPAGGLSFLFHNVVLLRYIELGSEVRRAVNVMKMRDSVHEKGLAQYEIDEHGFHVLGPLEGLTGVLGWSALRGHDGSLD
ncbi:MAG: RAD55 family ATPase [Actinomycetota bacterium]